MSIQALPADQVAQALTKLSAWTGDEHGISRTYRFADFVAAMDFMQSCVAGIEARQHHPEWSNVYSRVAVTLRTHDAGDRVTGKDLDLAAFLDAQAKAYGA